MQPIPIPEAYHSGNSSLPSRARDASGIRGAREGAKAIKDFPDCLGSDSHPERTLSFQRVVSRLPRLRLTRPGALPSVPARPRVGPARSWPPEPRRLTAPWLQSSWPGRAAEVQTGAWSRRALPKGL